jgi:hypothetical protein
VLDPKNTPRFGSDPEGFFKQGDNIIGSEKLIPENGISSYSGKVVRDGVQFELNPRSATSIEDLGKHVSGLFAALQKRLDKNPDVSICFDGLVDVSQEELASLSPATRKLGCNPSYNAYEDRPITVDPMLYTKRSSGGHIHIGTSNENLMQQRTQAIYPFDILVGNTCVMLDRDPGAAERRENYGRAGEFRMPSYGLEYRTISNWWLRDYTLMNFVFSLAHIAYEFSFQSFNGNKELWDALAEKVNIKNIVRAIDTNDAALALKNFKRLMPVLRKNLPVEGFALTPKNIPQFIAFAESVQQKGIAEFFPTESIVPNWIKGKQVSFNDYLQSL